MLFFSGFGESEKIDSAFSSYNIVSMPETNNNSPKRRKRKYRFDPVRLAIVGVVALAVVSTTCFSVAALVRSMTRKTVSKQEESTEQISLASSSQSSVSTLTAKTSAENAAITDKLVNLKNDLELTFSDQISTLADLKDQINAYLAENGIDASKVSWAIQDLVTNETVESSNSKQNFTAASTYKLPLCVYYYDEIAAGRISPSDTLVFTEEMREEEDDENLNQPIHRKYKVGDKIQIDELLEAALLYSDNIAGHMLYSNMGGYTKFKEIVAKYADVPQNAEFFSEQSNAINADYMMRLLNHIYNTPGVYNDLKFWLQYTAYDTFLNRSVPGTYIQKIGNINEVRNAAGIYNGTPPFTLSLYTCVSKKDGMNILADIGQLVLNYFQNRYNSGFYSEYDMTPYFELNAQMSNPPDVIEDRDGLNGQKLPEMTEEEKRRMSEEINAELGDDSSSASSAANAAPAAEAQPQSTPGQEQTAPAAETAEPAAQPADPAAQNPAAPAQ